MAGTKRPAEAVGFLNIKIGKGAFCHGRSFHVSDGGRGGSENVGLSNENIGENPMPRKPKGSSTRFVRGG